MRVAAGSSPKPPRQKSSPLFGLIKPNRDEPLSWRVYAQERARKGSECPVCLGLKVTREDVSINDDNFGKLFDCPACSQGRMSEYLRQNSGLASSGTTSWLSHVKRSDWRSAEGREPQFEATMKLITQGKGWLTLWGPFGVGKTWLLACAVNEFIQKRQQSVYVTAGKLLDHLRDAYGPDQEGYSYAFGQWSSCYALAIDEVDSYHKTSWAADKYRQLMECRYNLRDESVTLLACNIQPGGKGWPDDLGWLASRMSEFPIIEAGGGDVRPLMKGG